MHCKVTLEADRLDALNAQEQLLPLSQFATHVGLTLGTLRTDAEIAMKAAPCDGKAGLMLECSLVRRGAQPASQQDAPLTGVRFIYDPGRKSLRLEGMIAMAPYGVEEIAEQFAYFLIDRWRLN